MFGVLANKHGRNFRYSETLCEILFKFFMLSTMTKKALIIIDVQNYFVNELTKSLPEKIVKHVNKTDYDFIVLTKFINKKGSNFFKLLNWKKMLSSDETEIHNSLIKFSDKKNVFAKTSYSIFKAKGLNEYLEKNKISSLYLCGINTEACVLASAFEGFDLGFDVKIIKELCSSNSGTSLHNSALRIIEKCIE